MDQLTLWGASQHVKKCNGCKRLLPPDAFDEKPDGTRYATCSRCMSRIRQAYKDDPRHHIASVRRYQERHADELQMKRRIRWEAHLEHEGKTRREYKTPEQRLQHEQEYQSRYNQTPAQKKRCREWGRRQREADREGCNRRQREWNQANRDKIKAKRDRWTSKNKHKRAEFERRRHAKKIAARIGDPTEIQAFYRHAHTAAVVQCHWCKQDVPIGSRHVDHINPLSRGGAHAVDNLCCSCARCNTRKSNLPPDVFIERLKLEQSSAA